MKGREYRYIIKKLFEHDSRFTVFVRKRGKGSRRIIKGSDKNGASRTYPLPYKNEKTNVSINLQKALIRQFGLPPKIFED